MKAPNESGLLLGSEPIEGVQDRHEFKADSGKDHDDSAEKADKGDDDSSDKADKTEKKDTGDKRHDSDGTD